MNVVQRSFVVLALVAAGALGGASAAPAARTPTPKVVVRIAPEAPTLKSPITVSFTAPRSSGRVLYSVGLELPASATPLACSTSPLAVDTRPRPGRRATVTLRPITGQSVNQTGDGIWCPGKGRITIGRFPRRGAPSVLARRSITVVIGPGETQPPEAFIPVKTTILPGSTLTASAPGRPDRTTPLTGLLRGQLPGRFLPNMDVTVGRYSGAVTLGAFPPDPLCPGATPPATFDLLPATQMVNRANGTSDFTLVVNGAPSQLFGCGPAGPLGGTTTIPLSGKVGPKGLLELPLSGSVAGIPLPGGTTGGLTASLLINQDLSGAP